MKAAILLLASAALSAGAAHAQSVADLRKQLRDAAGRDRFGDLLQGLAGFATLPGVSSASFTVDAANDDSSDTTIRKLNLPLSHQFAGSPVAGGIPYSELTLGYLTLEQSGRLLQGTPATARVDVELQSFSAIGGFGLAFPLGRGLTLRPSRFWAIRASITVRNSQGRGMRSWRT